MKTQQFNKLINSIGDLNADQMKGLEEILQKFKCGNLVFETIEARTKERGSACPHCESPNRYRHGVVDGLQRYRCKDCGRTYNSLSSTPLSRLRQKQKWIDYLSALARSEKVRDAAKTVRVHRNTAFRWRHRFLRWIAKDAPTELNGITEADETYFLESQKGNKSLDRKARKRGGRATLRGLSREQVCVVVARDRSGQTADFVTGKGPASTSDLLACLAPVLNKDVLLVTDGGSAFETFAKTVGITHEAVIQKNGKRVRGAIHVQNVNAYHSRLKEWIKPFHGVATKYLEHYLGWKRLLDRHKNPTPDRFLKSALGQFQYLTVT